MIDPSNNSYVTFAVNNAMGDSHDPSDMPLIETSDLAEIGDRLVPGDYEGTMSVAIVQSGDCLDVPVTFHVTTDRLVDVETDY